MPRLKPKKDDKKSWRWMFGVLIPSCSWLCFTPPIWKSMRKANLSIPAGSPSNPEKIGLEPWLDIENSAIWRAHKKIETQKNLPDSVIRSGKGGAILEETTKQLVEVTLPPDYLGANSLGWVILFSILFLPSCLFHCLKESCKKRSYMLTVSGLQKCEIMCRLHPHPQSADTKDSLEFSAGNSATWLLVFLKGSCCASITYI